MVFEVLKKYAYWNKLIKQEFITAESDCHGCSGCSGGGSACSGGNGEGCSASVSIRANESSCTGCSSCSGCGGSCSGDGR